MQSTRVFAYPNCPLQIPTVNMSNTPPTSFRFKAKNIFLTYPNCPLHKNDVSTQLKVILHHHNITYILVCEETHASGEPHVHAMVQLQKQFETRNCRFFDIYMGPLHPEQGPTVRYHPNIEPLHSPAASQKYLKKSGNFYEDGVFNNKKRSPSKNPNAIWKDILATASDINDFLAQVKDQRPQDFVLRWPAISSFANDHYKRVVEPFMPVFTEFQNLPQHIQQWATDNILFVSKPFIHYDLCYNCSTKARFESENTLSLLHHYYCDDAECRTPRTSPTGLSPSTSAVQADQARHAGQDHWAYTTTSRAN
uniref:Replication-associated protein n=1 Tax=Paper mulberry leaf curling associated virus 2 TaxID=2738470 RepID=A0A6M6DT71_9GEMI|nr:C1 [Paper mulberry leaf curling associated virus 2]